MTADVPNVQCCYAEYFYKHLVRPLKMRGLIIYLAVLQCLWYKSHVVTQNMFCNNFLRQKNGTFKSCDRLLNMQSVIVKITSFFPMGYICHSVVHSDAETKFRPCSSTGLLPVLSRKCKMPCACSRARKACLSKLLNAALEKWILSLLPCCSPIY